MNNTKLSNVALVYLNRFDEILDNMISGMTDAAKTDSISHNFILQMIPHHRAAIDMSYNILKYTTNMKLEAIAKNIITEQKRSIENMEKISCVCSEITNSKRDLECYTNKNDEILRTMFKKMKNAPRLNNVDVDFMREMIPHHRGAIEMSKNALRFKICPELIPILDAIIASQRRGVIQMERLLSTICQ